PSLGGLLIKLFGAANALLADALSFFLAAAAWFSLGPRPSEAMMEVGWRAQLLAGLRWVVQQRVILENTLSAVVLNIVYASMRVVAWGGVPIGAFLGGTLTQLIGVRWMIGLGSGLAVLLFATFALASETKRI